MEVTRQESGCLRRDGFSPATPGTHCCPLPGEGTTAAARELPSCSVTGEGGVPTLLCIQTCLYTTQMLCCNVPSNTKLLQILSHLLGSAQVHSLGISLIGRLRVRPIRWLSWMDLQSFVYFQTHRCAGKRPGPSFRVLEAFLFMNQYLVTCIKKARERRTTFAALVLMPIIRTSLTL